MHATSRWWMVLVPALALATPAPAAGAFGVSGAGGRFGIASPEDFDDTVMLGGHLELERPRTRLHLMPNVIGGVRFPGGSNHYFLEGRYTASEISQVAVLGGITFGAGR